jgi:hypothetical protein
VFLQNLLCPEHQQVFADLPEDKMVDFVDPSTAEVQQVDGLQNILITHCAKQPEFITQQTTLVDSVFRLFLANGNVPLTPVELADRLGRQQPMTILKTLSGMRVYKGIRPCLE